MFTKGKKRQYLALSVALALGGAWCGGASYQSVAEAADLTITGASPVIPAANEAKDEGGAVVGAAAGVENDAAKTTTISGKTTEVSGAGTAYAGNVYGGYSIGSGNVTGNTLDFKDGTLTKNAYAGYSVGSVTGNTATMTGGTVNKLYGGYSVSGAASTNTVKLDGTGTGALDMDTSNGIVGGEVREGKGNADGNTVSIDAGAKNVTTTEVYGGKAAEGGASNNTVTLKVTAAGNVGTTDVIGAQAGEGDATHNKVTIEKAAGAGGTLTVTGDVYGAKVMGKGNATDNKVKISAGASGLANVIGGESKEGSASKNTVELSGSASGDVIGGRAKEAGKAEGNKVKIGGAGVIGQFDPSSYPTKPAIPTSGDVIGGKSEGGDVRDNEVTIATSGTVGKFVYGGLTTGDGKAEGNTVKITKGTVIGTPQQGTGGSVWGGRSVDGAVKNNTVEISGKLAEDPPTMFDGAPAGAPTGTPDGTYITYYVYGGHATGDGAVEGNTVTVTGGTVHAQIYGGWSKDGVVKNNEVKISGSAAQTSVAEVSGGKATGNGAAEGNKVEIDSAGVKANNGSVTGGETANGDAKGNTVTFTKNAAGSEVANVYGGYVGSGGLINDGHGSATDNTVVLHAGTIGSDNGQQIYGGRAEKDNATGNKVILEKDVVVNSAQVYGGWSGEKGDASRNEVTLRGDNVKATFRLVYGGQTDTGHAERNKVAFHGGKVITSLVGGEGDSGASSNEVTIEDGDFSATTDWIIGGRSGGGSTDKNTVTIHKVVHDTLAVAVMGGKGGDSASENTVTLGEMTTTATVTGGSAGKATHPGSANKNIVNLTNVKAGAAVTGGDAIGGSANENKVTMTGGKVTAGDLIGGKTTADTAGKAGDANKNVLTLTKVRELQAVTGGASAQGTASENIVTIDGTDEDLVRTEIKGAVFGGYTAGGAANHNEVTLKVKSGKNVTGGNATKGDAEGNKVAIEGGSFTGKDILGGRSDVDGAANGNEVKLTKVKDAQDVVGGSAEKGSAEGNKVTVTGGSFHDIIGGESTTGGSADKNEVKLTNLKAISGTLVGGAALGTGSASGNTVDVSSEDGDLAVTGAITGGRAADGSAESNAVKLTNLKTGATVMGGNAAKVTVEKADVTKNTVEIAGGKFSAVTGGATNGGDATENTVTLTKGVDVQNNVLGGEAATGKAADNKVTVTGGKIGSSVVAGLTGTGDASGNEVTLRQVEVNGVPAPGNPAGVAGGVVRVSGNANSNKVTLEGNEKGTKTIVKGDVAGGSTASGDASGNVVSLKDIEVRHAVYGGQGTAKTNDNTVRLNGVTVGGTVYGGTGAAESLNNTLEIYGKASTIGDFSGVQNLHFYVDSDRVNDKTALLTLTSSGAKDIKGLGLGVKFSGDAKILHTGDQMTLLKASGALTTDDTIENKFTGSHGSSLHYEFDIAKAATDDKTLVATVTAAGMKEETKSYVETRAALADMVNHAGDVVAGESLSAAKKAAAASANAAMDRYQVWAGMGANAMRAESGSYVDTKGWSFGLGWARQDGGAAKKTLFSPFVEYGRGDYDSYLDNGTHGSGAMSYLGLGLLARVENEQGLWYEGSLRGGRSTSDYTGNGVSYDGDNTYYGAHLGVGQDIKMENSDTVTPYLRYFYSHQNSMTATLTSGETYDFGSVNSHRVRLGVKYAHAVSEANEFYAGLAYEYEFGGDATATFQGFDAPTPSLKGASGMLELGYRFTPEGQPLTYDLHLTGWQGVRRGFSGGAQVTWAF